MRNNKEKQYILFNENNKIEEFTERICNINHIYNYFGSISMVLNAAFILAKGDIELSFEKCISGTLFLMTSKNNIFNNLNLNQDASFLNEEQLLIKMLTDKVNVTNDGKTLEMIFYVNGIEPELFTERKEKLKEYFSKNINSIKNINNSNTYNK